MKVEGILITVSGKSVRLTAVESAQNTFSLSYPDASLLMHVDNPEAAKAFAKGRLFFVDFTPCPSKLTA